jgi:hypothetical protein
MDLVSLWGEAAVSSTSAFETTGNSILSRLGGHVDALAFPDPG